MAADLIYLGKDVQSFQTATRYAGYDKVVLNIDDRNYVSSPSVSVTDATKWDERSVGEYQFVWNISRSKWYTPFSTYANTAALIQNYGITPYYSDVTSAKDGDVITVIKESVNGETTVTAEITRSGSTLEADCPLVKPSERQSVADSLLSRVYGFEYQPFAAEGAYMNPAAEIGDAINAYNVYAGVFEQETTFNRLFLSKIGSAIQTESEVEMQYDMATDRKYTRRIADTEAQFKILADEISSIVTDEEFQAALTTMSNQISAKVSATGGNSSSFSWSLTSDGFVLYSNGSAVFKCDSTGITVTGDGTFTGNVYASNIKSTEVDGYGGSFSAAGITPATITTAQCGSGVVQSLGYADVFNAARASTSPLQYFKAAQLVASTSVYSPKFIVADISGGTNEYNLNGHYHSFSVVDDKIVCGAPNNSTSIDGRSFNIVDTQACRDAVSAVQVASRAVLYCNSSYYRDYTYDCDMTGSSYHYTPSGESYQYGRVAVRNSSGTDLAVLRVKLPAGGSVASITSKSTSSDYSDYYYSGGWKLYVHAKDSNGNVLLTDSIDVQHAVDYGASQGGGGTQYSLYCVSRTENSAGLVTCDFSISSYNGLPWSANSYYTFTYGS